MDHYDKMYVLSSRPTLDEERIVDVIDFEGPFVEETSELRLKTVKVRPPPGHEYD